MHAELVYLNYCSVPVLSRTAVNLSWYDSSISYIKRLKHIFKTFSKRKMWQYQSCNEVSKLFSSI